ncbi:MAG: hypothetical protein LC107_02950 [Chitinophagales bacterium]|nr:hypothetical protein [Chitinophagales bacterium]
MVGVVYQFDYRLDLTDSESIDLLPIYYDLMKDDLAKADKKTPENKDVQSDKYHDLIIRELDCAVIEYMHQKIDEQIKSDIKS